MRSLLCCAVWGALGFMVGACDRHVVIGERGDAGDTSGEASQRGDAATSLSAPPGARSGDAGAPPTTAFGGDRDGGGDGARGPDGGPRPAFEAAPCPLGPLRSYTTMCGFVTVPEARRGPVTARTVRLAVAIVKSPSPAPKRDPLVYLEGGPGGAAMAFVWPLLRDRDNDFDPFLRERDLIVVDQRGTGFSRPSLNCPELEAVTDVGTGPGPMMMVADLGPEGRRAVAACRARLHAEGIDLGQYTSAASADDFEDVRRALGGVLGQAVGQPAIERWNLFGVSYGTRLGLEILRRHPQGVRSAILDSVLPADVDLVAETAANFQRAYKLLFAMCEAQDRCRRSYPDLRKAFVDTLNAHNANPGTVPLPDGTRARVTGALLAHIAGLMLYDPEGYTIMPELVFQWRDRDYRTLPLIVGLLRGEENAISEGVNLSVICADEMPFTSRERLAAAFAALEPDLRPHLADTTYASACEIWNVPPSTAVANEAVASALPGLVLSGELDPVTPPAWGARAAASLGSAQAFSLRGQGHAVFGVPCARGLMEAFLADPTKKADSSCLGTLTEPMIRILR